jgi:hypothetical protein
MGYGIPYIGRLSDSLYNFNFDLSSTSSLVNCGERNSEASQDDVVRINDPFEARDAASYRLSQDNVSVCAQARHWFLVLPELQQSTFAELQPVTKIKG